MGAATNPLKGNVETPKAAAPLETDAAGVDAEASEIRANIAHTRAEMGGTIEALHGKLNPTVLKEQAIDQFHEAKETIKAELQLVKDSLKAEVKAEIDEVRAAVREATVGKVEHMVHDAQTTVTETSRSVFDTIKANPIPVALIGMGVAWLLMSNRKGAATSRDYRGQSRSRGESNRGQSMGAMSGMDGRRSPSRAEYDRGEFDRGQFDRGRDHRVEQPDHGGVVETLQRTAGTVADRAGNLAQQTQSTLIGAGHAVADKAGQLADKAGNLAHQAQTSLSGAGHTVADKAGQLADKAGHLAHQAQTSLGEATHAAGASVSHFAHDVQVQGRRAENQVEHMFYDNPLLIGAGVLAVGTAIGLAIPISRKEDEWMGRARDQVVQKAQELAHEALGKVEDVARNVADEATHALAEGERQQVREQTSAGQQWGRDPYPGGGQSQGGREPGSGAQPPNGTQQRSPSSYRSI